MAKFITGLWLNQWIKYRVYGFGWEMWDLWDHELKSWCYEWGFFYLECIE